MAAHQRPLKVFLCHASQDKPAVRELARRLFTEGWIDPWLDEKKLLPGQDWRLKIEEAVETSDIVIICLSNNSVSKEGFIQKELRYAKEIALEKPDETIFLIPLRLEECETPRGLRFYQWGDYFGEKKDETYTALLQSLELRYQQKLMLEEKIRARQEKERVEREAAEKAAQEKAEREAAEGAARRKLELEAAEKIKREKATRDATEKAAQETAKREATEKARREKAEHRAAQVAAAKETLSKSFIGLILAFRKGASFLWIGGIVGVVLFFFWAGSWALANFNSPTATSTAALIQTPSMAVEVKNTSEPATSTTVPTITPTKILTPTQVLTATAYSGSLRAQITDSKGVSMVLVPAGDFIMGSEHGDDDEKPVHTVYLDAFYIDKYEVTNALYSTCVNAKVCVEPESRAYASRPNYYRVYLNYPVYSIDWSMANAYCEWRGARLPSESEWEKAARGTDGRTYPWGETLNCSLASYRSRQTGLGFNCRSLTRIGSYEDGKSIYGVYDLVGNVSEWVADWYLETYYQNSPRRNPPGPPSAQERVYRGGAWSSEVYQLRSSDRGSMDPSHLSENIGFRCAKDATP